MDDDTLKSGKTVAMTVYILQAVSFLFGITFLVAVIINYVKKDDVEGTWLASHFRWQIRTFWYVLLWSLIGGFTIGLIIGYYILFAAMIWFIYRIVKGFLRLTENREMYV